MDTTKVYEKMCEKAVKQSEIGEAFKQLSPDLKLGTRICFRSFIGITVIAKKGRTGKEISSFMPETLALRTWTDKYHDLNIIATGQDFSDEGFPLFSQDQLQEMVEDSVYTKEYPHHYLSDLLFRISEFYRPFFIKGCSDGKFLIHSMRQLWLMFIMYKKHSKIWNGKDWVKGERGKDERIYSAM